MKQYLFAAALVAGLTSISAFAQAQAPAQPADGTAQVASDNTVAVAPGGQWVPPYGQQPMQKTRAQVYQELLQAEKDGQLAYLNSTIYAHP